MNMARFDLMDFESSPIQPLLSNKPRGVSRDVTSIFYPVKTRVRG